MKIVHLIPASSHFTSFVKVKAESSGQFVIDYKVIPYIGIIKPNYFIYLWKYYNSDKDTLFIFHQVPFFTLICLSLFLKNIKYALYFWGGDFYNNFLPVSKLRARRQKNSSEGHHSKFFKKKSTFLWFEVKRFFAHIVVKKSAAIVSLSKQQFRILKSQHFMLFKKSLELPYFNLVEYNNFTYPSFVSRQPSGKLTFLISNSAASTLNHKEAVSMIKKYQEKWDVKVNIRGYLSYGGGSDLKVERLEKTLLEETAFAESVKFEKNFLDHDELLKDLKDIDIALFSCDRDEGVSMLSQLVRLGGVLVFEKNSINYGYFKTYASNKTIDYNRFLANSPEALMNIRNLKPNKPPSKISYDELNNMKYKNNKLTANFLN